MKPSFSNLFAVAFFSMLLAANGADFQTVADREPAYLAKARPLKGAWTLSSGPQQNLLVELYTALNCPACPPGDIWLDYFAELDLAGSRSDLWTRMVPVAWHVTYFDRPGMLDLLGQDIASVRQDYLVQSLGIKGRYTPAIFTNGLEWRGLREGRPLSIEPRNTGELKLVNLGGDLGYTMEFIPAAGYDPKPYRGEMRGWLILQVGGIYTDPRRGPEAVLPRVSSFAVQVWKATRVTQVDGKWTGKFEALPLEAVRRRWPGATFSIASWLTNDPMGFRPIQAVGSWVK